MVPRLVESHLVRPFLHGSHGASLCQRRRMLPLNVCQLFAYSVPTGVLVSHLYFSTRILPNFLVQAPCLKLISLISTIVTVAFSPVFFATTPMSTVHTFMCCDVLAIRNLKQRGNSSQPVGLDPFGKPPSPETFILPCKGSFSSPRPACS